MTHVDDAARTAVDIVDGVQSGYLNPLDLTNDALTRMAARRYLGAVQVEFQDDARAAALALGQREDLGQLPLAGVPVLVKDNVAVAGHPMREGSLATSPEPQTADHEVVRRLRAAGAVLVGSTRVPELIVWASTDSPYGITRNPWNPTRTSGGSSGGSAVVVAAGIVPVAHGNDGMGSIRIPAACNGVFGIKPGRGVVPSDLGADSWGGMAENGPMGTTVSDAALLLSVMAAEPELAVVKEPATSLRVAVAANAPSFVVRLSPAWRRALNETADALRSAGHSVTETKFPYPANPLPVFARWFEGVARDAESVNPTLLQRRTLRHVRLGRLSMRRGWVNDADAVSLESTTRAFFADYDVLLTPMLARTPPKADLWHRRSWFRNIWSNVRYAPYAALWNLLGWPAASVPAGIEPDSATPTAVQVVAPQGQESRILSVARQLERLRPWRRTIG